MTLRITSTVSLIQENLGPGKLQKVSSQVEEYHTKKIKITKFKLP